VRSATTCYRGGGREKQKSFDVVTKREKGPRLKKEKRRERRDVTGWKEKKKRSGNATDVAKRGGGKGSGTAVGSNLKGEKG